MTVKEMAVRLGVHLSTAYDLIEAGEIPCHRVGLKRGKIVVEEGDVDEYWRKSKVVGGSKPKRQPASTVYRDFKLPE